MLTAFSGCSSDGGEGDQIITPSTNSTDQPTDASTEATTASTEAPSLPRRLRSRISAMSTQPPCISAAVPGTDYGAIGGLKMGDQVKILGKEGDWYKIEFKETGGYVSAQFIQGSPVAAAATTTAEDIPAPTTTAAPQE